MKKIVFIIMSLIVTIGLFACVNDKPIPSIEDVQDAISSIEHITLIEIVTEDNDPNGQLGKQGGYTGCLFFLYSLVEDNTEVSAIDAGTVGGGSIEIYANEEDAQKRNEYLGTFDGTIFASGSHVVLGTLVIRTSNELTASQQSELETEIINALNLILNQDN